MLWIALFSFLLPSYASSFEIIRPLPDLPVARDPSQVNDIMSCTLAQQIHAGLFELDKSNTPIPKLVERFSVSKDGTTYKLSLKNIKLRNGKPLTSILAKKSLENAIKNKAVLHEELLLLVGAREFLRDDKVNEIRGLVVNDAKTLTLELKDRKNDILKILSDVRYSVWDVESGTYEFGFGDFDIVTRDKKSIEFRAKNMKWKYATKLTFMEMDSETAFDSFVKQKVDDLFFYHVPFEKKNDLAHVGHIQSFRSPRTYGVFLNSRTIVQRDQRNQVLYKLDAKSLVASCYPKEIYSWQVIPSGYIGHIKTLEVEKSAPPGSKTAIDPKLKLYVMDSIGAENCVVKHLKKNLSSFDVEVSIEDVGKLVNDWSTNKVDGFVAYIDAEDADSMLSDFHPKSRLGLGDAQDSTFESLFDAFLSHPLGSVARSKSAAVLAERILTNKTIAPLFHPNQPMVYSRKFKEFLFPLKSPCFIKTKFFEKNHI